MSIRWKRKITLNRGRQRKRRPKTFTTEEAAKKWAAENKIKAYELVNLRNADSKKAKKIRIELKE